MIKPAKIFFKRIYKITASCYFNLFDYKYNENFFVISGIPRSGTSLISSILDEQENCLCFNEIYYDVRTLNVFFMNMRKRVLRDKFVYNKLDKKGDYITSTNDENKNSIRKIIYKVSNKELKIGSKVNTKYLDKINFLLNKYKIMAMVRDPVYTLGSWNTKKLATTPMNKVENNKLHPHWQHITFNSENKVERQAEIREYYASFLWNLRKKIMIVKYEDLVDKTDETLSKIANYLKVNITYKTKLINYNLNNNYEKLNIIKEAVKKYCCSRKCFGYS
jgi:hypothetical protein